MSEPLVSFLIPVYNGEAYLEEAIRSARAQTYDPIEIVVVDDGSTDESPAILARLAAEDGRIRVHRQENAGHAGALNAALALARGELVAILDCDDEALPDRVETQVRAFEDDPALAAVGGAAELIDHTGRSFHTLEFPTEPDDIRRTLETDCPFLHSAVTMRRAAVLGVGGYRPALSLVLDYDLWFRLAEHHRLANLPRSVVRYRIHPAQTILTRTERIALAEVIAKRSAAARRLGRPDPVSNDADQTLDELSRALAISGDELDTIVVRNTAGAAKLVARVGDTEGAKELFALAEMRARATGDPALRAIVAQGRARVRLNSRVERLRAALTRPVRRRLGRI